MYSKMEYLELESSVLKKELVKSQKEYKSKLEEIKELRGQIHKCEREVDIVVSEHAVVRYLERVGGMDIDSIRGQILTGEVEQYCKVLGGSGKFPNSDFSVVMKDYVITTVVK